VYDENFQGFTVGGESPVGLAHEQQAVDELAAGMGWGGRNVQGIAYTGNMNGPPASQVAAHELVHLRGIKEEGRKTPHDHPRFKLDRMRQKMRQRNQ